MTGRCPTTLSLEERDLLDRYIDPFPAFPDSGPFLRMGLRGSDEESEHRGGR
jgi:hypothetical protein